jgi:signal peptidase I
VSEKVKKYFAVLTNIVLVLCGVLIILTLIAPAALGLSFEPVLSGSMEPTIMTGAMIAIKKVDPQVIKVGDIIGFHVQGMDTPVCHRVIEIVTTETGYGFRTQGDSNNAPDTWTVRPQDVTGKVYFNVGWLGKLSKFVKTTAGFITLIMIPAVLIVIMEIRDFLSPRKQTRKRPSLIKKTNHWPVFLPIIGVVLLLFIVWGFMVSNTSHKPLGSFTTASPVTGQSQPLVTRTLQNKGIFPLVICLRSSDPDISFSESHFLLVPGAQKEISITGDNSTAVITTAGFLPLLPADIIFRLFTWNSLLAPAAVAAVWIVPLGLIAVYLSRAFANRSRFVSRGKYLKGGVTHD